MREQGCKAKVLGFSGLPLKVGIVGMGLALWLGLLGVGTVAQWGPERPSPVFPQQAGPCVPPPPGLVAWWPMDTNLINPMVQDIAGANHGTPFNVTSVNGVVNGAIEVDGANGAYVEVPNSPDLNPGEGDFTIDAWVLPEGPPSWVAAIVDKTDGVGRYTLHLEFWNGQYWLGARLNSPGATYNYLAPLPPNFFNGQWRHVAVVVHRQTPPATDPSQPVLEFYVDGALIGTVFTGQRQSFGSLNSNAPLLIGRHALDPGAGSFRGRIDELEFFNRALSAQEIQALFNAGAAGKCREQPGQPDLSIEKRVDSPCPPGGPCTVTITITNAGNVPFTGNVRVSDSFTGSAALVSWSPTAAWSCSPGPPIVCDTTSPITLNPGDSVTLTLQVTFDEAGQNCVSLELQGQQDANPENNRSCAGVEVTPRPPEPECPPGERMVVLIAGERDGFDPDTDSPPASPSSGFQAWIQNNPGLQPTKPLVGFDSTQSNIFFAHSFDLSGISGSITRAWLEVGARPLGPPSSLVENDTLSLRVVLPTGNGTVVQVTDPNTAQLTDRWGNRFGNLAGQAWNSDNFPNGRVFLLDLANLPLPSSPPPGVTSNLLPHMNVGRSFDVFAEDDTSIDYLVLTLCVCELQEPPPGGEGWDLTIRKRAQNTPWAVGTQGTIVLEPENLGPGSVPASAAPVTVTDTLPAGLTPVSASGTNWNCTISGQTVTCTWTGSFPIPPGPLPPITITVDVRQPQGDRVRNCASIRAGIAGAPSPEPNTQNNEDCVDIPIGRRPGPPVGPVDIDVTPRLNRCIQPAGRALKLVLVRNRGEAPVEIVDVRPTGADWQDFQLVRGLGTIRPGGLTIVMAGGTCTGDDLAIELHLASGEVIPASASSDSDLPSLKGSVPAVRLRMSGPLLEIRGALPSGARVEAVELALFDLAGRRLLEAQASGPRLLVWLGRLPSAGPGWGEASARPLANGVYLARVTVKGADGTSIQKLYKLVRLR